MAGLVSFATISGFIAKLSKSGALARHKAKIHLELSSNGEDYILVAKKGK